MRCPHCNTPVSMAEITEADRTEVLALRQCGQSMRQISEETGLNIATVHRYLAQAGMNHIGLRPGPRPVSAALGKKGGRNA